MSLGACAWPGCSDDARWRRLCRRHYERARRRGRLDDFPLVPHLRRARPLDLSRVRPQKRAVVTALRGLTHAELLAYCDGLVAEWLTTAPVPGEEGRGRGLPPREEVTP